MQTTYRAMTGRERAELQGYVAWSTSIFRAALFVVVGLCFAGVLRALVEKTKPGANFLWWVGPVVLLMAFLFSRAKRWTGGREFRHQVKADLKQGALAVHRVDVAEAIEVEEQEDEGPGYFVKTVTGEVMVFAGQYLDTYKRRKFPWKSFEIVEAPASKAFFALKRLDVPLAPSFIRQPFTWEEFKQFNCKNYKVIDADFESLKIRTASKNPSPTNSVEAEKRPGAVN
jgi:hypothetical protein